MFNLAREGSSRVHGRGVFAADRIRPGQVIIPCEGERYTYSQAPVGHFEGGFLQVGPDTFLGPSGKLDDLVNHSCSPNAYVLVGGLTPWIVSLTEIPAGHEITIDYSLTMWDDPWAMKCSCGFPSCRGVVREFRHLPDEVRSAYVSMRVVPAYVFAPSTGRAEVAVG